MKKTLLFFLVYTSITACSWDRNDPGKFWFYPKVGAKLVLHQPLVMRPDTAALYIQQGKVMGGKHSRFDPYCKIRVRNVKETEQTIHPDTFTITRSGYHTEIVAGLSGLYVPLEPNPRPQFRVSVSNSDAPSDITETIFMALSSSKQPDVLNLICGGVEDHPANAEPPTFSEMKKALGNIMSFTLN